MQTLTPTATWPAELDALFARALTVEYASLTRAGTPVTVPVTPYVGAGGRTLDVSTGLTYPLKAERARRDPRVALLFGDPLGTGLPSPPVVLVQGLATVRDADLQAGTDRYVREALAKSPDAYARVPAAALRRLDWYFARIWVEVTPTRITWWPQGDLGDAPRTWTALPGTTAPPSDPAPAGGRSPSVLPQPADWRDAAAEAVVLPLRDLTVVDEDGRPAIFPLRAVEAVPEGFRVLPAAGVADVAADGPVPACFTAHTHSVPFTDAQNRAFAGTVTAGDDGTLTFAADRRLADWSIPRGALRSAVDGLRKGRRLRPRLATEAARRGQAPPAVRLPAR